MYLDCRPTSECILEPRVLNFDSKNWWKAQKVIVKGRPDNTVDGTQVFHVYAALSSEKSKYNRAEKAIGRGQNSDVDTTGIDLFIEEASTFSGGNIFRILEGSVEDFRFELRSIPRHPVNVTITITALTGKPPNTFPNRRTITPNEWNSRNNLFKISCQDNNIDQDVGFKITLKADSNDKMYDGQESVAVVGICVDGDTAGLTTTFLNSKGSDTVVIQGVQFSEHSRNTSTLALNFATNPTADVTMTFYSTNAREVKVLSPLKPQKVLSHQPDSGLPPTFNVILQSVDDNKQDGPQRFCIKVGCAGWIPFHTMCARLT